jgi:hypothetical protein
MTFITAWSMTCGKTNQINNSVWKAGLKKRYNKSIKDYQLTPCPSLVKRGGRESLKT